MRAAIITLIFFHFAVAARDDVKIYENRVPNNVEEHIMGRTLLLLEDTEDFKVIAGELTADLDRKFGVGWQCLTGNNVDFSTLRIDMVDNSLFWFSYKEKHFYLFQSLNQIKNETTLIIQARKSNVTEIVEISVTEEVKQTIIDIVNVAVSHGSSIQVIIANISSQLQAQYGSQWYVEVMESSRHYQSAGSSSEFVFDLGDLRFVTTRICPTNITYVTSDAQKATPAVLYDGFGNQSLTNLLLTTASTSLKQIPANCDYNVIVKEGASLGANCLQNTINNVHVVAHQQTNLRYAVTAGEKHSSALTGCPIKTMNFNIGNLYFGVYQYPL